MNDSLKKSIQSAKTRDEIIAIIESHKNEFTAAELASLMMDMKEAEYSKIVGKICSRCMAIVEETAEICPKCGNTDLKSLMTRE